MTLSYRTCLYIPLLAIRKHKKGLEEDVTKKRTRRAQKFQRAVVGATLQVLEQTKYFFLFLISTSRLPRTSWRRGTRSLRCEKPRESRLCAPPRIRRRPPSRSPLSRYILFLLKMTYTGCFFTGPPKNDCTLRKF